MAGIDAPPLLDGFRINFFHQAELQVAFDIPQFIRFFGHLESFRPSSLTLEFNLHKPTISFLSNSTSHSAVPHLWHITDVSDCQRLDWQVISVAQICSRILPFRYSVKSLNIKCCLKGRSRGIQHDDVDFMIWSQLFHSFTSVHSLYIPATLESSIAPALQGLTGEPAAELLPSLGRLSIVGNETAQLSIESFLAAHQHSGRPVVVSRDGVRDIVR